LKQLVAAKTQSEKGDVPIVPCVVSAREAQNDEYGRDRTRGVAEGVGDSKILKVPGVDVRPIVLATGFRDQ